MRVLQKNNFQDTLRSIRNTLQREDISFITIGTNPWHALSIDAALSRRGGAKGGIVIITPHVHSGYMIDPSDFTFAGSSESIFIKTDITDKSVHKRVLKSIGTPLGYIQSTINYSSSNRLLRVISPEQRYRVLARLFSNWELSNYYSPYYISLEYSIGKVLDNPFRSDSASVAKNMYRQINSLLEWVYRQRGEFERRRLFSLDNGVLAIDNRMADDYKRVLGKVDKSKRRSNQLLFVSQPLSEAGMLSMNSKAKMISKILQYASKNYDKLSVKPHPRENKTRLKQISNSDVNVDIDFISERKAIERLIPELNPSAIIGCTSSSLVKSSAFFNIESYTTANLVPEISNNKKFASFCQSYQKAVQPYVDPVRLTN